MNDESIRKSLEAIARQNIPENTNLWPRLAARLERKDTRSMNLKWKLIWTILLVLLGLFALTGVAYAFYRYFNNDAGLQSVSNAGLLATVNATAQPTLNPTATPPAPVTVIGESQTLEGVSLTLDWVYLMDGQQAFGFSADGIGRRKNARHAGDGLWRTCSAAVSRRGPGFERRYPTGYRDLCGQPDCQGCRHLRQNRHPHGCQHRHPAPGWERPGPEHVPLCGQR